MPRTHQAPQGAAASSSASNTANYQHSPAHRRRLANEPVNLYVTSAWPLPNGSPHGLEDSEKDRRGHAHASGTVSPVSKTTSTQLSEVHAVGQLRSFFETPARLLPTASPTSRKKGSGKQRLRQFWAQVLEKPDTALLLSPSRQRPQVADGGRADKTSKCSSTNIKDDSSSELDSPVSTTIDVKKIVAFPIPGTPAHFSGTPEPSDSPELFTLPVNVTMRRRRATRNVSPLVLPELLPEHLTERLEQEPEGDKDGESDDNNGESDESDYGEDMGGATEIPSARAPTVPLFPSPDLAAYRRIIHEEMARCYGAHIVSPASTAESPASTVSGVSTGGHISSPPAVETTPASSPSTLATAFTGLSAQPRLSPILKLSSQQKGHLSTVLECTETSHKESGTTALWAHPEESLITNARQPSLIDGNFSSIAPLVAFGHEELDRQSEQPLSDSLLSFMKHERSILQASSDEGAVLPNS